jgi:flagellar export protein FliJ
MRQAKRLEQVAQWAAEQEKQAAKALAACAQKLEEAKAKLETLQRFRAEYLQKFTTCESVSLALRLAEWHAFLSQLSRAIEAQEGMLERLRQEYAARQFAWQRAHCRCLGIEKVRAKLLCRQKLAAERSLQREQDDRAARRKKETS